MIKFREKDVHVYSADVGNDGGIDLDGCWHILSSAEKAQAKRFHFDLHRHRYIRAHGQLRRILALYLDTPPENILIETESRGKPFVASHNIHFNMSHSADIAVFAVTGRGTIGIDVELFDRKVEIDELSRYYYTLTEQQALALLPEKERREMFFWLWTAKEARMKVTGEGLALDPRLIDVVIEEGRLKSYRLPMEPKASLMAVFLDDLQGACTVAGLFAPVVKLRSLDGIYLA